MQTLTLEFVVGANVQDRGESEMSLRNGIARCRLSLEAQSKAARISQGG
jgi:hypothetical protein